MKPRVVVLMSTYQGERFVREQIDSILSQLPADGQLLIRDDGSSDRTVELVKAISDRRIALETGPNLGFGASFLTLLAHAPADADMVMFSDQDDVWLPGKIARAWHSLQPFGERPALYGSAQMLADAELQPLRPTVAWARAPSFAGALVENVITGCTSALNAPALRLLQRAGVVDGVQFHDWWCYLVVSAFGRVVFDPEPTLLYRQHGGNQLGHGAGWLVRRRHMARFLARHDWVGILLGQVGALMAVYGDDLPLPLRRLVEDHFAFTSGQARPRWRLIFSARRWREHVVEDVALHVLLALHRLHLWPPVRRRFGWQTARSGAVAPPDGAPLEHSKPPLQLEDTH